MFNFKKPKISLERPKGKGLINKKRKGKKPTIPDNICIVCPGCKGTLINEEKEKNFGVCKKCGHHFSLSPMERIELILDEGSFVETDSTLVSNNPIDFPDYENKYIIVQKKTKARESVVTGYGSIEGIKVGIFIMNPSFMMGSMGVATGEKITRLFEESLEKGLPVIGFTASGGARMQEGLFSLMQMAKTSGAVKRHSDAGNLYITFLTNPTTGGVTASFGMEGDIILSEPKALIGFAGPRVIAQTIGQMLPKDFQKAEKLLELGFVDDIVERSNQKAYLAKILRIHS